MRMIYSFLPIQQMQQRTPWCLTMLHIRGDGLPLHPVGLSDLNFTHTPRISMSYSASVQQIVPRHAHILIMGHMWTWGLEIGGYQALTPAPSSMRLCVRWKERWPCGHYAELGELAILSGGTINLTLEHRTISGVFAIQHGAWSV